MSTDPGHPAATRLGRALRATTEGAKAADGRHRQGPRQSNWLRDGILRGQGGLGNILGLLPGRVPDDGSETVLVGAGLGAAITEAISMGAVGYTSSISERDYYGAERAREATEIDMVPEAERKEIRDIYASKGFTGTLLDGVVETITANRETWLGTMMDEELHLQPVQSRDILRTAVVITI